MITVLSPQGVVRGSYENNMPESTPYFDDLFTDNLETMETSLRFSVPLESPDSEWLEGFSTVLYPDKDRNLRELTVINVWEDWSQEQPVKTAVCEDASIDSLLKTHTAPFVAGSLEEAIHGALAASDWQFLLAADTLNIGYQLIEVKEYSNVRSVLETIRQAYGIEYRFVVKFDGARITRQLQVYKEYGQHTGKYFIYNRDLTNIEREVDFSNVFTAALPYWIEDDAAQTIAGYTPRNPVKGFRKDYTMDNVQHIAAHDEFDRTDKSRMLIFKASSNNPELAYLEACNKLLDYISPTYTYTVNVLLLENVLGFEGTEEIHLGDYVWLKEKVGDAEIGLEARVIQLTSSHTSPEQDEVVFTNFKEISVADSDEVNALRDLIQQIQEQQDEISEAVTQTTVDIAILQQGQAGIIEQLGDVPSVSVGDTPNPNPKQGDIWFTDAVDPETGKIYSTIKVWSAVTNDWDTRYSAKDAEEALEAANEAAQAGADAKAAADAAKEAADDATAAGQAATEKADQAATDAKAAKDAADAIKVDVGKLQTDVGKAQTDASKALTDSASAITKVGQVDSKVTTVTNDVNGMKTTIADIETTQGQTTQKLTEVETNVDGLTVTVGQVKTTADSALSKATTVETTVEGLKVTVGEVKTTADGAMQKATQVEATAEGLKTTITAVESTVNRIDGGGSNLISNGGFENDLVGWTQPSGFTITTAESHSGSKALAISNVGSAGRAIGRRINVPVVPTRKYEVSYWYKTTADANGVEGNQKLRIGQANGSLINALGWSGASTEWSRKSAIFTAGANIYEWVITLTASHTVGTVWWDDVSIIDVTDREATNAQITQITATVDGLTTTVSQVKTTADSALSKATSVEQTANGLTTTVATIQTDIVDLTNRFPDFDFKKQNPKPVAQDTNITASYDSSLIIRNNATAERRIYWSLNSIEVGKSYNIKAKVNKSAAGQVGFRIGTAGDFITFSGPANTTKFWVTGTIAPTTAGTAFSIWLPAGSALRVDELYIYEANTNITSSQITQLSDNINLKVDKNGVIAQINVSSEGILIDGKYVRITGTTTIDNGVIKTAAIADLAVTTAKIANLAVGTAQIGAAAITEAKIGNLAVTTAKIANLAVTDAKIGSLSANKITTGTLDAGVINVINLNASNITSGTLSGLKVESPYDVPIASGATSNRRGSLSMTDGYLRNVYQTYVRSTGAVTGNGELTLTHEALTAVSRTGAGTTTFDNSMQLHAFGLTLQNSSGQGGTLSFQDLYSQATTSLMPASGWSQYSNDPNNGNHPTVTRQGRLVTLAGAFSNNNQLPADNNSYTMTTIPVGFRPAQLVKWLAKGSGTSIFMITVESNGTLYINYRLGSASGGFGYVVNASGNLFNIAGSYSAADI